MENFTISKSKIILCLIIALVAFGGYIIYEYNNHDKVDFDPAIDMIDPDNPVTKGDMIIKLQKLNVQLKKEKTRCNEFKDKIKLAKTEQNKFPVPDNFYVGKSDTLTTDAFSFINFYYNHPLFSENTIRGNYFDLNLDTDDESVTTILQNHLYLYTTIYNSYVTRAGLNNYSRNANPGYNYGYSPNNVPLNNTLPKEGLTIVFKDLPQQTNALLDTLQKKIDDRIVYINKTMGENSSNYEKHLKEYKNSRFDMSGKAISWGIVAFVLTAIVLYIAGLRSREETRKRMKEGKETPEFYEDLKSSMWYSVYLITVLLLIITIFVLGLARLLTENTLAALLGGIAGYVLNNKQSDSSPPSPQYLTVPVRGDLQINEVNNERGADTSQADKAKEEDKGEKPDDGK